VGNRSPKPDVSLNPETPFDVDRGEEYLDEGKALTRVLLQGVEGRGKSPSGSHSQVDLPRRSDEASHLQVKYVSKI
jgi:hypothetical protein